MQPRTPPPGPLHTHRAFTLIELLTVIAIIGILAAILIPTVAKIKDSASRTACANNLHQIAVGTLTYASDNKGLLPARPNSYPFPHSFVIADWNPLKPYLGDNSKAGLMYCPGALQDWRGPSTPQYDPVTGYYITYSYFGNISLTAAAQSAYALPAGQSVLKNIRSVPANFNLWTCLTYSAAAHYHGHSDADITQMVQGQNAARADGSVRWVKGPDLMAYFVDQNGTTYYGPSPGK